MAQIALAWILSKEGEYNPPPKPSASILILSIGVTAPIVGTTSITKLKDLIGLCIVSPR